MLNKLKGKFKWAVILIIILIIIPLLVEMITTTYFPNNVFTSLIFRGSFISKSMPDNVWVIVYNGEYYPALKNYAKNLDLPYSKNSENFTLPKEYMMRAEKAREIYDPNSEASNRNDFIDNHQFFITTLLRKIGILPERKGRWDKDGSWNW